MSVYDDIRQELKREKLSNQYFDYSNALDVVNRIEARAKQKAEAESDVDKQSDSERLKNMIEFVYANYPAKLEEILCHYIGQNYAEFPASRMCNMVTMLNQTFVAPRISDAEHAMRVSEENAGYLKTYCEGKMYTTEEEAKKCAPLQARNAGRILEVCRDYRKGDGSSDAVKFE